MGYVLSSNGLILHHIHTEFDEIHNMIHKNCKSFWLIK
jgi:hypothetical protein